LTEAGKTFNEKAGAGVIGVADDGEVAVMTMGGLIAIYRFELCFSVFGSRNDVFYSLEREG